MTYRILGCCLCLIWLSTPAEAADYLLYFEAQGVAGYSNELDKPVYYSLNPDAEMQKPSLGFDYLKRISGESGDSATLALQARLAITEDTEAEASDPEGSRKWALEPQIYNAYGKVKSPFAYIWGGHNRPAFGLGSYFDSHGLILRTLPIQGFGYDRDWGVGLYRDFSWGDVAASVTTGSGMPVYFKGNYMTAARISYGVLSQDNFTIGFSLGYGRTLDTMGYKLRDEEPLQMELAGLDMAILRDAWEHRFDALVGTWFEKSTYALFYRLGVNLDPEGRLKIEGQPTYWKLGDENNYQLSLCLSSQVTSSLTARLGYTYDYGTENNMIILQLYYYKPL